MYLWGHIKITDHLIAAHVSHFVFCCLLESLSGRERANNGPNFSMVSLGLTALYKEEFMPGAPVHFFITFTFAVQNLFFIP